MLSRDAERNRSDSEESIPTKANPGRPGDAKRQNSPELAELPKETTVHMARTNHRFWSTRRFGVGIYAVLGAATVAGCSKGFDHQKTDQAQITIEQEESAIGQTREALTFNTLVWEDQFTSFKATTNKPVSPYSSHEWYIQQHFRPNGEFQDYLNVVCDSATQAGSTGTAIDATNWVFCLRNEGQDGKALQVRAKNVNGTVRSGRLNSKRFAEFAPTAAEPIRMSVRIKLPSGAHGGGFWPAVWFLQNKINEAPVMGDGDTSGWPCIGAHEIDLFEHGSNSNTFNTPWGPNYNKSSMHGRESGCVPQQSPLTIGVEKYTSADQGDNQYHTWAVELETRKARFYYDGVQYGGELNTTGRQFETHPWFWIINVAAGGSLGGNYNAANFNGDNKSIYIDWVRVEKASNTPTARNNWGTNEGFANSIKLEAETNDGMLGMTAETTTDVGGGQNMGFIDTSDWVEHYVDFTGRGGDYNVVTRNAVNNPGGGAQYRLLIDGTQMATVPIAHTGGWQTWASNYTNSITISSGKHWVRFLADTSNQNLNWLVLKPATAASCTDEVKNGAETGVDCGSTCGPCPSCNNGIQDVEVVPNPNPNNAVSTNGSRSQDWTETGIDCGGPCAACNTGGPGSGAGANLEAEMGTLTGVTATYSDVSTIQAELATGADHHGTASDLTGTPRVKLFGYSATDTDWFKLHDPVDLTNVSRIVVRAAALNAGGKFSVRIDSPTGTKIAADYTMPSTGAWTTFTDQTVNLTQAVAGSHSLYLRAEAAPNPVADVAAFDYIKLQKGNVTSLDGGDSIKFTQVDMTSVKGTQFNFVSGGTGDDQRPRGQRYGHANRHGGQPGRGQLPDGLQPAAHRPARLLHQGRERHGRCGSGRHHPRHLDEHHRPGHGQPRRHGERELRPRPLAHRNRPGLDHGALQRRHVHQQQQLGSRRTLDGERPDVALAAVPDRGR